MSEAQTMAEWVERLYDVRMEPDKLLIMIENKRAQLRRAPAPAQAREDEALSSRKLAEGIVDSVIGAFKKYYPCRPDERIALIDAIEAAIDKHDATLRSRQSPQAVDYERLMTNIRKTNMGDLLREVEAEAAAPQPSPQGEDAEAFRKRMIMQFQSMRRQYRDEGRTEWLDIAEADWVIDALRARLSSAQSSDIKEDAHATAAKIISWTNGNTLHTGEIANLLMDFFVRHSSAQSSAQGEEAREMREAQVFRAATNAIYFNDSSDYKSALYEIIEILKPGYAPGRMPFFETDEEARADLERKEPR